MRNLTQSTYNRIVHKLRDNADRHARSLTSIDASDLLAAYESAMELLDALMDVSHNASGSRESIEAGEFLYFPNGEPRVEIEKRDTDLTD
jgi:hypothetical protein